MRCWVRPWWPRPCCSATLKFDGNITLQIQGGGLVHLLVVQCTSGLSVRGLARWHGEVAGHGFHELIGDGRLVVTIEQTQKAERYQGIVPLEGDSLSASLEGYFKRSEQLATRLWLTADAQCAAGMLLQVMPDRERDADAWDHVTLLGDTVKNQELTRLSAQELLHRLYNEDDVRLFEARRWRSVVSARGSASRALCVASAPKSCMLSSKNRGGCMWTANSARAATVSTRWMWSRCLPGHSRWVEARH